MFLVVAFPDDRPRQIKELLVNRGEEREERSGMREFVRDALFEHGEKLVEGALERLSRALGMRLAEERGNGCAKGGAGARRGFK